MTDRKYLPTFADLVDRLSIVLMKSIFIHENRDAYREELELIKHDLANMQCVIATADIYPILVLMLVNRVIWENESYIRMNGDAGEDVGARLRFTHSLNGIRNAAKNWLARSGERIDLKVDCLAADLPKDLGNWRVFE